MTFDIGQQTAGVINNVAGDQRIEGGQHGSVSTGEARRAVRELRDALAAAGLDEARAAEAHARVAAIDAAVRAPRPDRRQVAGLVERLTRLLAGAGSLTAAGATLIGPLQTLAGWLGAHGATILSLLPL